MRARLYRRGPIELRLAALLGAGALALLALGLVLDALPEHGVGEWNGLPLGEYGLSDVWGGILVLGVLAAVCAVVALVRGRPLSGWQRRIAVGALVLGGVVLGLTLAVVVFAWVLCGSGACD